MNYVTLNIFVSKHQEKIGNDYSWGWKFGICSISHILAYFLHNKNFPIKLSSYTVVSTYILT